MIELKQVRSFIIYAAHKMKSKIEKDTIESPYAISIYNKAIQFYFALKKLQILVNPM